MNKKFLVSGIILSLLPLIFLMSVVSAQELNGLTKANNQFAFELYSKYTLDEGNILFSPYSVSLALTMLYEGARGKTQEELKSVLHFTEDDFLRRKFFLSMNALAGQDKKYKLRITNALWVQKEHRILKEYLNLVERYYAGKADNVDFLDETDSAFITINNWVREQTNNSIENVLPPNAIRPSTRSILTSTISFRGDWAEPFDKGQTAESNFNLGRGKTVKTKMMSLSDKKTRLNYSETEGLKILELPYEGEALSMLILLPLENSLSSLEETINAEKLAALRATLKKEFVSVYLPRFKLNMKYFMADTLMQMGMPTAFSNNADFSGITMKEGLAVNSVIHQLSFEADEGGKEGTVDGAVPSILSAEPAKEIEEYNFIADHAFMFVIQEKETGNILFLGRIIDPNVSQNSNKPQPRKRKREQSVEMQ